VCACVCAYLFAGILKSPHSPGCGAVCCSVLQCVAVCCSVLQCVAVCCRVFQCVAGCCSAIQRCASSFQHPSASKTIHRSIHRHHRLAKILKCELYKAILHRQQGSKQTFEKFYPCPSASKRIHRSIHRHCRLANQKIRTYCKNSQKSALHNYLT